MKQEDKIENILEAATKRFAHFGVDKTTMNEIADDLGISKASLYYYFPDKLNLFAATLKRIIDKEQEKEIPFINEADILKGIHRYLEKRTEFIIRNYRILEYMRSLRESIPEELKAIFFQARHRDYTVLSAFLKKGKEDGILSIPNLKRTAELLHDSMMGLRISLLSGLAGFFPDEKQFDDLLSKEKELATVFFKALQVKD